MKTIEYKVSFEKIISRLSGLFAYLESDDYGVVSLHKATDSLDGCWGRIVENIKLPSGVSLNVDGNDILKGGEVYSFRTIIDYYYQYRKDLEEGNVFVAFIEKAIGKVEVEDFEGKTEATPKFLYLSNVKRIYNELVKMRKMCDFYHDNQDKGLVDEDKHLCCLCERYSQMGGDNFKDYVGGLIPQAEEIAEEYYGYAESNMTLDFDVDLVSTHQDFGILTPYAPIWLPYKRYYVGDNVEYDGELYVCTEENTGKWSDDYLTVVFDDTKFNKVANFFNDKPTPEPITLTQPMLIKGVEDNPLRTDSKLVDLRRYATYYNDDGIAERPIIGEDWLFYYRKGVVVNITAVTNIMGNIVKLSDKDKESTNGNDLMAYGDVIEDITYDAENKKIKFIYRIGVHLKSNENPTINYDDDGNQIIKWNKFVWDNNDKIGIKYEEEYNYEEGSDLDKLINGDFNPKDENGNIISTFSFNGYITGLYDKKIPTCKFEFITINNTFNYSKTIANQDVNIVSLLTDFELYRKDFEEFAGYNLFKEDYLNGITYKPTKDIDVNIKRGSTSVFDKHIAFGEVKTMDDMVAYKNSSFFKLSNG